MQITAAAMADSDAERFYDEETVSVIEEELLTAFASVVGRVITAADEEGETCRLDIEEACARVLSDDGKIDEFGCCEIEFRGVAREFDAAETALAGAPPRPVAFATAREFHAAKPALAAALSSLMPPRRAPPRPMRF